MPFGESIAILAGFGVFVICLGIVCYCVYRVIRTGNVGVRIAILFLIALIPPALMIGRQIVVGNIEYNPRISSRAQLIGTYSANGTSITLHEDGTYSSAGLENIASGTWSNNDWNLNLTHTGLTQPRIVTRNGIFCIAPYYAGVDDPLGVLLKKENKQR